MTLEEVRAQILEEGQSLDHRDGWNEADDAQELEGFLIYEPSE